MSEQKSAEEQREEAERLAREEAERDKEAAAEREREEAEAEEAQKHEAERKARKSKMYPLASSPTERLGYALAFAGVPLLGVLAPHVVDCQWEPDGTFELTLAKALSFEVGERTLDLDQYVTGLVSHEGISELEGIHSYDGAENLKVLEIGGETHGLSTLDLTLQGARKPVEVPAPDINQTG